MGDVNGRERLRLVKYGDGREQVVPADKDEGHMKSAEEAVRSCCPRCQRRIEYAPFFRVRSNGESKDRYIHADPCAKRF